ncbi:hypothetical protein EYR38_007519 [Pleurotus pulmonarius]|nr:hypothetical protein EYR38_007519 [Pleurotus pulmonarius]
MSESTSGFYTDAASDFADNMSQRSGSATPTPAVPPMPDGAVSRCSSADVSMHSRQTCTPMDTSPIVEATMGPPPPSHLSNTPMQSQSFFDMLPHMPSNFTMPSSTYMPSATVNPAMLTLPTPPMPSNVNLVNGFPCFSGSFDLSTNNFIPAYDHNSNSTFAPMPNIPATPNTASNISTSGFAVPFSSTFHPQLPPDIYNIQLQPTNQPTGAHSAPILAPTPRYPGLIHSPPPISGLKRQRSADDGDGDVDVKKRRRTRLGISQSQPDLSSTAMSDVIDEASTSSTKGKHKRGSRARGVRLARTESLSSLRLEVSELKKARAEAQKFEQARNSSHVEALQRETNLCNLLSFKDKRIADLRYHHSQSSQATPSQDLLDLQSRLHALEQAKQDDAEAADVQYRELKERYDTELEELQRAIDVATGQQSHEASISEQHLRTIENLNQQLQSIEAEASERYQELEKKFSDASQQWKVDEDKRREDHEGVVADLRNRIQELEDAYTKLGSDAQSQRRVLEDQLEAASQQREQARREDHERIVGELNDRIRELENAYTKLGSDAQDQRRQLEDQYYHVPRNGSQSADFYEDVLQLAPL